MRERGDMTMAQIAGRSGWGAPRCMSTSATFPPLDGIDRDRIDELAA